MFEQLLLADEIVQPVRELDIVGDHAPVTAGARLEESEPDLEGAKATRVLRAVFEVVLHFLAFVVVELVVGRLEREGIVQILAVANERATRFERSVQPLVRIDGDRVGESQSFEIGAGVVERDGRRTVRAIDVEPEIEFLADLRDLDARFRPAALK